MAKSVLFCSVYYKRDSDLGWIRVSFAFQANFFLEFCWKTRQISIILCFGQKNRFTSHSVSRCRSTTLLGVSLLVMCNECYCSSSAYWHPSPFLYYLLGHIYKCLGSDAYQPPPRLASLADTYKCRHGSSAANRSNSQL